MPELRWLTPADAAAVLDAADLFDNPPTPQWTEDFLARSGHHLCLAYVDGAPAGFVTGIEILHPDKGMEMLLYELGVDERFRGRGIGRALVMALDQRARDLGCSGMWVLTDEDNEAAQRTYQSAGATGRSTHVMFDWQFSEGAAGHHPEAG